MASKAQAIPAPVARVSRSSPGIIHQVATLLLQPRAFFRRMPQSRQWLWIAALILIIFGLAASNQVQSGTSTSTTTQDQGFNVAMLADDTAATTTTASTPTATTTTTDTGSTGTNTALMSALQAACGVLALWAGQAILLGLVPMQAGRRPKLGRNLQIAIWASLPLALMLGLRQIYFAAGGTGGTVGLALLLEKWSGYADLSSGAQRLLAALMSNISLFWLWSLVLLYCGARYTLGGKYWVATLLIAIWIAVVPAVTVLVSDPVTTVAPRTTTSDTTNTSSSDNSSSGTSSTTTTSPMMDMGGGQPPSGNMGGGPGSMAPGG